MPYENRRAELGFVPPRTLEDGDRRKVELVAKLDDINGQLGLRREFDRDSDSYVAWRRSCVAAKRFTEAELRMLNLWLKEQRRSRTADSHRDLGFDPRSPTSLLLAAANVWKRIRSSGVRVVDEEEAVFRAIGDYLEHGPVATDKHPEGCECQLCMVRA